MWIKVETEEEAFQKEYQYYKVYMVDWPSDLTQQLASKAKRSQEKKDYNRLNRYEIYKRIGEENELISYIPEIQRISQASQIFEFVKEYKKVVLKNIEFSKRKPTFFIELIGEETMGISRSKVNSIDRILVSSVKDFESFLSLNNIVLCEYIIQKYIDILTLGMLPFTMNVSMTKAGKTQWENKAIYFNVGRSKIIINQFPFHRNPVALKKSLKSCSPVGWNWEKRAREIVGICSKICRVLDTLDNDVRRYKFHLGIDLQKKLWILDMDIDENLKAINLLDYEMYYSKQPTSILYNISFNYP